MNARFVGKGRRIHAQIGESLSLSLFLFPFLPSFFCSMGRRGCVIPSMILHMDKGGEVVVDEHEEEGGVMISTVSVTGAWKLRGSSSRR